MLRILTMKFFMGKVKATYGVLLILIAFCNGCGNITNNSYDFPDIIKSDTLRILTLNTSTSYFIYRDQYMGYHYDMISNFCKEHELVGKIIVVNKFSDILQMLLDGEGDVIAYNMPVANGLKNSVIYAGLSQISHQVLVQRAEHFDSMITDVTQLIGKRVSVVEGSKHYDRLENLNKELGGGILIEFAQHDTIVEEDLIRMVSRGEIDYTVADDDFAKFNQTYFRNLDVHLNISFDQRSSWTVRKDSPILADSLNSWIDKSLLEPSYLRIIKRYFEEAKGHYDASIAPVGKMLGPNVISPFDVFFRMHGEITGIDWRLLASVAFQESTFNSEGVSWAGARGLMGLMPTTAASLGVESNQLYDPEINISTGAKYLNELLHVFRTIESYEERVKIALAAYNGGIGHVYDARALAEEYGSDADIWYGSVEKFIQLKHLEQYYTDPVCKNGYFRGDETVAYVRDVVNRWEYYKLNVKE